jgi:hypothetical protein
LDRRRLSVWVFRLRALWLPLSSLPGATGVSCSGAAAQKTLVNWFESHSQDYQTVRRELVDRLILHEAAGVLDLDGVHSAGQPTVFLSSGFLGFAAGSPHEDTHFQEHLLLRRMVRSF